MSGFPERVLQQLRLSRIVAVFSVEDAGDAVPIVQALSEGGVASIELTLRTPAAMDAVRAIRAELPDVNLGVGTILTIEQVAEVKECGAAFGVSPGLNPSVVKYAREVGLPFAPGIATPSELESAIELGCRLVKFFPAEPMGGVKFLKSMSAPYKHLQIEYIPHGGVNVNNMQDYFDLPNVLAIGGSFLVDQQMVKQRNWSGIKENAEKIVQMIGNGAAGE